ncbi:MAG: DUF4363 family protein [Oscillospiraceae bacterium]|nr:DUF4363 family protein [Oscillospiraceae bacterium]
MKRIILSIVISVFIIAGCVLAIFHTKHTRNTLLPKLNKITHAAHNKESGIEEYIEAFEKAWEKEERWLWIYSYHRDIDEIDALVSILQDRNEHGELTDLCIDCSKIAAGIEHLYDTERISIYSIF